MTFANDVGQISTDDALSIALEGAPADMHFRAISMINRLRQQANTATITSGSDITIYTLTATYLGQSFTVATYTSAGGDNATVIATGLAASYNNTQKYADTYGMVESVTSNAGVVTITFRQAGVAYTLGSSVGGSGGTGTIALAQTVAPGGTEIPFGHAVMDVGTAVDRIVALPTTATALTVAGVTVRDTSGIARDAGTDAPPPSMVTVMTDGEIWVENTVGTAAKGGQVYVVLATGAIRATADGGNTVAPTGWVFTSAAAASALARIKINR